MFRPMAMRMMRASALRVTPSLQVMRTRLAVTSKKLNPSMRPSVIAPVMALANLLLHNPVPFDCRNAREVGGAQREGAWRGSEGSGYDDRSGEQSLHFGLHAL